MQLIESFICGKENNPYTCEDGLFISERYVAVIDGVTAKGNRLWDNKTSGAFAKDVLIDCLQALSFNDNPTDQHHTFSAIDILNRLDRAIRENIEKQVSEPLTLEEYPRASIILYDDLRKEIISYGDCQCRINDVIHTHTKKIDEQNASLRAYHLEHALLQGRTFDELKRNDIGRTAIQEQLLMQFSFENKIGPFGYPVLNGTGIEPAFIQTYPVTPGDEIILASDGYPTLEKNLEETEQTLKHILEKDPLCFQLFPSTKGVKEGNVSFDDRTYCRIKVTP